MTGPAASDATRSPVGRGVAPTTGVTIEVAAGTRAGCLEAAARALVAELAGPVDAPVERSVPVTLDAADDVGLLRLLLEEVISLLEVLGVVPVDLELEEVEDGTVAGFFETVPTGPVGAAGPRRVVRRAGLALERRDDGRWEGRATIDVRGHEEGEQP